MIEEHYRHVKEVIGSSTALCVVSKKRSAAEILSYYDAGERIFGENHAQELLDKAGQLPNDIRWQFIGHLQRNKVREVIPYVDCIQSLDNRKLAGVIEKEAARINKIQNVLIEFHLARQDENKTGIYPEEADAFLDEILEYPHMRVIGMMAMGPHTDDQEEIRRVFQEADSLFERLKKKYGQEHMQVLSLGMSADYPIAVSCGSTMVRIGTYLFEK